MIQYPSLDRMTEKWHHDCNNQRDYTWRSKQNWGRKFESLHQSRKIIKIWMSQRERWGSSPLLPIQEENNDMLHENTQKTDKCHNPNVMIICTENFTGNENWQTEAQERSSIGDPYSAWKWDGEKIARTKLYDQYCIPCIVWCFKKCHLQCRY